MFALLKRNLKLHFRNRVGLAFSFLAVGIAFLVCAIFLEGSFVDNVMKAAPEIDRANARWLIQCWIMAGLLSVTPVTTSCGAFTFMVNDREMKIIKDFKSAPLKKYDYPLAAILNSILVGFMMSMVMFAIFYAYMFIITKQAFTLEQILQSCALVLISAIVGCCVNAALLAKVNTISAFSNYSMLLGTNIGFFNGIYLAIGTFPTWLQTVLKLTPFAGVAAMQRCILGKHALETVFEGAPAEVLASFREFMGFDFYLKGTFIKHEWMFAYLAVLSLVCFILFIIQYNKKQESY